jgi:hypothetical protein
MTSTGTPIDAVLTLVEEAGLAMTRDRAARVAVALDDFRPLLASFAGIVTPDDSPVADLVGRKDEE